MNAKIYSLPRFDCTFPTGTSYKHYLIIADPDYYTICDWNNIPTYIEHFIRQGKEFIYDLSDYPGDPETFKPDFEIYFPIKRSLEEPLKIKLSFEQFLTHPNKEFRELVKSLMERK